MGDQLAGGAALGEQLGEHRQVDRGAARVQVQMAGRELGELGEAAGQRDPRDRVAAQVLERAADEVAHVDQRDLGKP